MSDTVTSRSTGITLHKGEAVDLHMHSPISDGFWTTESLPQAAQKLSIKVLALTDHDDTGGVPAMVEACAAVGIYVLPGLEMSTYFNNVGYHMLALNVDLDNPVLQAKIANYRAYYADMVNHAVKELEKQGKPLDPAKSARMNTPHVKLFHLVDALIDNGYAHNKGEAYGICNQVGAWYGWSTPMEEAIQVVHQAGGVAVIAHPGRAEPGFTAADLKALDGMREAGLDGIEVFHPFHSATDVSFYMAYAEEHGMLVSTGSDTHSPTDSRRKLTAWPANLSQKLLEACGIQVSNG